LLLSQETYVQEKPDVSEGAWYSDEQLAWLKERLAGRKDDKPVFVMIHQPLPAIGQNGGNHSLIRAKELRDILKPHTNVFLFSGHTHQDFQNGRAHYVKETFHWFHNSSVGRVLNAQYKPFRENVAQGLYVQVFADKIVLRGREFIGRTWIKEADWTVPLTKQGATGKS
jgi:3',5'-cyclic AMP phosphodiesterase CpdA